MTIKSSPTSVARTARSVHGAVFSGASGVILTLLLIIFLFPALTFADTITPFIEVDMGYSDNVRFTRVARSSPFIKVMPGLKVSMGRPNNNLFVSGRLDYAYYTDISEYSRIEGGAVNARYTYAPTPKWIFDISNSYLSTYDPPIFDTINNQVVTLTTYEGRRHSNIATARLTHRFGPDSSIYAEYTYGVNEYENDNADDSRYHRAGAGMSWRMNPDWRLDASTQGYRTHYDSTPTIDRMNASLTLARLVGPTFEVFTTVGYAQARAITEDSTISDNRDYRTYSISLGLRHDLTPRFSYGGSVGWSKVVRKDLPNVKPEDNNYPIVSAWMSLKGETWRFLLSGETNLGEYDLYGENAGLTFSKRFNMSYSQDLDRHWNWVVYATYVRDNYEQDPAFTGANVQGDVDNVSTGTTLRWTVTRYVSLALDYRYLYQSQETPDFERSQNRVMLILTGDYPYRW